MSGVQDMIQNVKGRVQGMREQFMGGSGLMSGRMGGNIRVGKKLGGGMVVRQAKAKADRISRRLMERKPGIMSQVKEFKPGSRVKRVFGQSSLRGAVTDSRRMSVEGVPKETVPRGKNRGRKMSVVVD